MNQYNDQDLSVDNAAGGWLRDIPTIFGNSFVPVLVFTVVANLLTLLIPLTMGTIVDHVTVSVDRDSVIVLGSLVLVLIVAETVISLIRAYSHTHLATRIGAVVTNRLIHKLTSLPLAYFQSRTKGAIGARIREVNIINDTISDGAIVLTIDLLFVLLFFLVMLFISGLLTMLVMGLMISTFAITVFITFRLANVNEEAFNRFESYESHLLEIINGIESIKTLALGRQKSHDTREAFASFLDENFRLELLKNYNLVFTNLYSKLASAVVIVVGCLLILDNKMTIGQIVTFHLLAGLIVAPLSRVTSMLNQIADAVIAYRFVDSVFSEPAEPTTLAKHSIHGKIEFADVYFSYPGTTNSILSGLNLEIESGSTVLLTGKSGAGKSTIVKLIGGLYLPTAGRVLVDNVPTTDLSPDPYRQQVAHVSQDAKLFRGSILDNLTIANPDLDLAKVVEVARLTSADEFISNLADGYHTLLDEEGVNLSGGQRQRLIIARELLKAAPITILDEATNAIDLNTRRSIIDNVVSYLSDTTVIFVSHEADEILPRADIHLDLQSADHAETTHLVLNEGRGT